MAATAERGAGLVAVLGVAAVGGACLGALLANATLVTLGLGTFLGEYGFRLAAGDPRLGFEAAVLAALAVVAAEAAYGAVEPRIRVRSLALRMRRVGAVAGTAAGAFALAAFVLAAAGAEVATGLLVELVGVAAAVAALGLVAYLARATRAHR